MWVYRIRAVVFFLSVLLLLSKKYYSEKNQENVTTQPLATMFCGMIVRFRCSYNFFP